MVDAEEGQSGRARPPLIDEYTTVVLELDEAVIQGLRRGGDRSNGG